MPDAVPFVSPTNTPYTPVAPNNCHLRPQAEPHRLGPPSSTPPPQNRSPTRESCLMSGSFKRFVPSSQCGCVGVRVMATAVRAAWCRPAWPWSVTTIRMPTYPMNDFGHSPGSTRSGWIRGRQSADSEASLLGGHVGMALSLGLDIRL